MYVETRISNEPGLVFFVQMCEGWVEGSGDKPFLNGKPFLNEAP